jgi:hypothetical protein
VFTDHLTGEQLVNLRDWVERSVRKTLDIPFNPSNAAIRFEHSMGQGTNTLPQFILRESAPLPDGSRETRLSAP